MKSKPTPTPKPLILNIADDLLSPIDLMGRLIEKEVHMVAKAIGIDSEELQAWITLQTSIQIHAPAKTILHLLRTAKEYRLDPLQEEVVLTQYDDSWQVSISIDGSSSSIDTLLLQGWPLPSRQKMLMDYLSGWNALYIGPIESSPPPLENILLKSRMTQIFGRKCPEGCCGTGLCSSVPDWLLRFIHWKHKQKNSTLKE